MYLKLALRNAKRSAIDYLIYMLTMTVLLSIMLLSNYEAITGRRNAGFETSSLPLLIALILVVLVGYINRFMLKQRAKEFANYILLGMEKKKLVRLFLLEFLIIGFLCFLVSVGVSFLLVFCSAGITVWFIAGTKFQYALFLRSAVHTFLYFCVVEGLCMCRMKRYIDKMEICDLMIEKHRNQKADTKGQYLVWRILFTGSFILLPVMLGGIAFLSDNAVRTLISVIVAPLLLSIFAFYKCLFQYLGEKRRKQQNDLYRKEKLYLLANLTCGAQTNTIMSGVYCTCLVFSAMSFVFGTFMLQSKLSVFDSSSQRWMGFLQINLCIIFLVLYFAILSLQQMIEIKQQIKEIRVLEYMGKSKRQTNFFIYKLILIKLFIPAFMCFVILGMGTPFLNYKLNTVMPGSMRNLLLQAEAGFIFCFLLLCAFYYWAVCNMSRRYMKDTDCRQ